MLLPWAQELQWWVGIDTTHQRIAWLGFGLFFILAIVEYRLSYVLPNSKKHTENAFGLLNTSLFFWLFGLWAIFILILLFVTILIGSIILSRVEKRAKKLSFKQR